MVESPGPFEGMPIRLLRFENAVRHDPAIDRWFDMRLPDRDMKVRLRVGAL
jgi:hypothetical protein